MSKTSLGKTVVGIRVIGGVAAGTIHNLCYKFPATCSINRARIKFSKTDKIEGLMQSRLVTARVGSVCSRPVLIEWPCYG